MPLKYCDKIMNGILIIILGHDIAIPSQYNTPLSNPLFAHEIIQCIL